MGAIGQAVNEARTSVAVVFRNRRLRGLNLAVAGSMIGDWALATAITVWAYGEGGAAFVGVWGAIRVALLAAGTPFGSEWANRYPPRRVMVATDLIRAVMTLVAAAFVEWGSIAPVFGLAILMLLVGTTFRQAQATMTTALVDNPNELTSATRVLVTVEGFALIAGPLLAGLLLSVADVAAVYVFRAATLLWSAVMVIRIGAVQAEKDRALTDEERHDDPSTDDSRHVMPRALHGFTVLAQSRDLRLIVTLYCAQCVLGGAAIVFIAAIAFDLVGLGASGVGYLESTVGVGAQAGVLAAILLGTRRRLATDFGLGALLWALALSVVVVWPTPTSAFITMALIGLANPIVDTNASIILQRITPQPDKGPAFAAIETALLTSMAFGALAMPVLMSTVGLRWSLVVLAVPTVVAAIAALPRLSSLDRTSLAETPGVGLLDSIPLFHLLPRPMLEALGGQLTREPIAAGTVILREGDYGEHFFVIESGSVEVLNRQGGVVNRLGPGDCFGEIALLHDIPRTLTVVATNDTVLHILKRDDFTAAMTRDPILQGRMGALATNRLQRS
jgi:predicted MFS family arabinose efflux permease